VALIQDQEREYIAQLEQRGERQVRYELEHGLIPPAQVHLTTQWLSRKEREAKSQREISQFEQIELMRRASDAAERQAAAAEQANRKATIALWISVGSLIVAFISIWITH
jgi:hypothetical protein